VEALRAACRAGEEGILAKHWGAPYIAGRGAGWVKVKCVGRQEFVIGGFTDPQRSRVGLGALLVGYYDDRGRFTYAGKVGTGYTRETLLDLRDLLGRIETGRSPFAAGDPPWGGQVHWVRPKYVAEIGFAEWTQNGLLRQPRFEGLREDKPARQVRRERPTVSAEQMGKTRKG
jgi:bifunctional non-homologous end joining protein LigD